MMLFLLFVAVSLPQFVTPRTVVSTFFSGPADVFSPDYNFFLSVNTDLDTTLVNGRYLLKHHKFDGLEDILEAYATGYYLGIEQEKIDSLRNATIITTFTVEENEDEELEITVTSSDGGDYEDTITFIPDKEYNITNPVNGELTAFKGLVMSSYTIQTISEGIESGNLEIKTWSFLPQGINLSTEVTKKNQLFPTVANQVMVRVDEEDKPKPLRLGWF